MKEVSILGTSIKNIRTALMRIGLLMLLIHPINIFAQKDSAKKADVPAEKEAIMISPSLQFVTVQKGDNTIDLKTLLQTKIKGSSIKLPLLKVSFKLVSDSAEKDLGFVITDQVGKAVLNVKAASLVTDKEGKLHFKAVFAGNKQMESADGEVTIKRARLEITPVKEDSVLTVKAKLIDIGTGTEMPVKEIVVGIYAKRLFNPIKLGEGTTDENGEASVEIPQNLPGDAKGNLTLLAKLDENEIYGNLESSAVEKWGIPVSDKQITEQRSLFSSNPPIWMLVTFIILMVVVWGHYLVIVFELFRLRKEEPHPVNNALKV